MNHPHPLDDEIDEMATTHRALVRLFRRDEVIDDEELVVLDMFGNHRTDISIYRLRQVAAECYERNGITRHVRRQFEDAGAGLTDLDAERQARRANVIQFPTRDTDEIA